MILGRTPVGPIIIARIGLRKIWHRIIFDVAVFDFIHVLTADLDAAVFSNDRQAAFLVLIPYRRRIVERTEASICEPKTDNA